MRTLSHYQVSKFRILEGFKRNISYFVLCFACLSLTACDEEKEKVQISEEPAKSEIVAEETSSDEIAAEVLANKEKWLSLGIKQYQIEMQKICYCVADAVRLMIFQVSDNEIKDVSYADSGDAVDPSHYSQLNTVEGMFDLVEQALVKNPASIVISYNDEYGYIKELTVDYQQNIADDEFTFIASNMKPK